MNFRVGNVGTVVHRPRRRPRRSGVHDPCDNIAGDATRSCPDPPAERRRRRGSTAARRPARRPTGRGSGCAWSPASTARRSSTARSGGARQRRPTARCCAPCARSPTSIIVGAGTVRAEGYGPPQQAGPAHRRRHRAAATSTSTPPLFTSGAGFLIIPRTAAVAAPASTSCGPARPRRPGAALRRLGPASTRRRSCRPRRPAPQRRAARRPTCVDEINLTLSPRARRRRRRRG